METKAEHPSASNTSRSLTRFAWMSIAAAIITITLKATAYLMTGSVGLLSDALESVVNLVAAVVALIVLIIAAREPDDEHAYGHTKAEYFSSGLEGGLILIAAIGIFWTSIPRLISPEPIEQVGAGLLVAVAASAVNGFVAWKLHGAAREYRSITLEADSRHLVTDIWTSAGVVLGVGLVGLTGWERFDAIVAIGVGVNILWTGYHLVNQSLHGLLDSALAPEDLATVQQVLSTFGAEHGIETHALRTRQAGSMRFVSVHVLVPGDWTVTQGHALIGDLEDVVHATLPDSTVFTHLEPLDDPSSWDDVNLRLRG